MDNRKGMIHPDHQHSHEGPKAIIMIHDACQSEKPMNALQETLFILKNAKWFGTEAGDVFQVRCIALPFSPFA